jgi:protein-L-isoaspartate(D-aspartate) O-methyltransferase
LAKLSPQDKVLEVGTGSGYQTALLSVLAGQVFSIERIPTLATPPDRFWPRQGSGM